MRRRRAGDDSRRLEPKPGSGAWIAKRIAERLGQAYKDLEPFVRRDDADHDYGIDERKAARAARDVQSILHVLVDAGDGEQAGIKLREKWAKEARTALKDAGRNLDDVHGAPRLHAESVARQVDAKKKPTDPADCKAMARFVYGRLVGTKFSAIRDYLLKRWAGEAVDPSVPLTFTTARPGVRRSRSKEEEAEEEEDLIRDPVGVRTEDERRLAKEFRKLSQAESDGLSWRGKMRPRWSGKEAVRLALTVAQYQRSDNLFRE